MECDNAISKEQEVGHVYDNNIQGEQPLAQSFGSYENSSGLENFTGLDSRRRRKRKTRRFKNKMSKSKPYSLSSHDGKQFHSKKMQSLAAYPQSEAPNNTNEFLIADRSNVDNLDDKLDNLQVKLSHNTKNSNIAERNAEYLYQRYNINKTPRCKEDSFTSNDSDDGPYYSSPEDEDEFLSKEFSNAYTNVHEEELTSLSKSELIKLIVRLEDRVDALENKLKTKSRFDDISAFLQQNNENNEHEKPFHMEIKHLLDENEKLHNENEKLRRLVQGNTSSSSSSSSSDSDSSDEMEEGITTNIILQIEHSGSKTGVNNADETMDDFTTEKSE